MRTINRGKAGFTLVELLTVIAIISLLIGILIPSLSAARTQAKATKTTAMFSSLGKAIEMFRNDNDRYPQSNGRTPFENQSSSGTPFLSGAQWLGMQMLGADRKGFVKTTLINDKPTGSGGSGDGVINEQDWLDWYALTPAKNYARNATYMEPGARDVATPETYQTEFAPGGAAPASLTAGTSVWNNSKLPFFVDSFGFPVLYYAANDGAERPFSTGTRNTLVMGRYDQSDNIQFTGTTAANGVNTAANEDGWDLGGGLPHKIKELGWNPTQPNEQPAGDTFAHAFFNLQTFEATRQGATQGKVWPRNPDTFILLSPGPDAIWGTHDDISNAASK
ncbi:MAG: prepilin-type N-terminal cleavage/methylation domain-containing protein [Phycisphaerales bacterium]|nr:prepilin-type N-terminal cleavage/methylation domain-containing protein [Phycisphaerales bacterium]